MASPDMELGRDANGHFWCQQNPAPSPHLPTHPLRSEPRKVLGKSTRCWERAWALESERWEFRGQLFGFLQQRGQRKKNSTALSLRFICKQSPGMRLPHPHFCPLLAQSPCLGCLLFPLPKFLSLFSSSASFTKPSPVIPALNVLPLLHASMASESSPT